MGVGRSRLVGLLLEQKRAGVLGSTERSGNRLSTVDARFGHSGQEPAIGRREVDACPMLVFLGVGRFFTEVAANIHPECGEFGQASIRPRRREGGKGLDGLHAVELRDRRVSFGVDSCTI